MRTGISSIFTKLAGCTCTCPGPTQAGGKDRQQQRGQSDGSSVLTLQPLARANAKMADGCKLFVYGMGENVSHDEMEQEFRRGDSVTNAYNTDKGYAFITMSSPSESKVAAGDSQMHGAEVFGQILKVEVVEGMAVDEADMEEGVVEEDASSAERMATSRMNALKRRTWRWRRFIWGRG